MTLADGEQNLIRTNELEILNNGIKNGFYDDMCCLHSVNGWFDREKMENHNKFADIKLHTKTWKLI